MMKSFFRFKYIILLSVVFTLACQDDNSLEYHLANPEIKLCMAGFVCPDSTFIVLSLNMKSSLDSIDGRNSIVGKDAIVTMYENGVFFDTLQKAVREFNGPNLYLEHYFISHRKAKAGNSYKVVAEHNSYKTIFSETYLPDAVPILMVDTTVNNLGGYNVTNMYVHFQDPVAIKNYYSIPQTESFKEKSESGYFYIAQASVSPNPIFDNYKSNSYDIDRSVPFFSDVLFQGNKISVKYSIVNYSNNSYPDSINFILHTINEDYYKYESSKHRKNQSLNDGNSDPVLIYSNITNGYGVFYGYNYSNYMYRF